MGDVITRGFKSVIARKNVASAKSFAYVGSGADNPGTLLSSHTYTLEVGKKYSGIMIFRSTTLDTITTDQGDTVTLRGTATSGGDSTWSQGFDFTATAVTTVVQMTCLSPSGGRTSFLYEVNGMTYQGYAADTNINGSPTTATVDITTTAGDAVFGGASVATTTGTWSAGAGIDTLHAELINTRELGTGSTASVVGGSPENFKLNYSEAFKNGMGFFLHYR